MLIGFAVLGIVLLIIAAAGWYVNSKMDHMFDDLNIPDKDIYY